MILCQILIYRTVAEHLKNVYTLQTWSAYYTSLFITRYTFIVKNILQTVFKLYNAHSRKKIICTCCFIADMTG